MKRFPIPSLPLVSLGLACLALASPATGQQFEAQQLIPPWGEKCVGCLAGNKVEIAADWAFVGAWTHGLLVYRRTSAGWVFHQVLRAVPGSWYPFSISAEAGTLVVGATKAKSSNGDKVGKAHVYELREDAWVQTQELQPSSLLAIDVFGASVSLFGNTLAVGAPGVDVTLASGQVINNAGAIFVYRRASPGEPWELEEQLLSPAAFIKGGIPEVWGMGISVGLAADFLAAGAPGDLGAVFLFERDSNGWHRTQILQDPTQDQGDRFGAALAISGSTLIVGEPAKDHAGRAFVFERDAQPPGEWGLVQELRASDGFFSAGHNDDFGSSLDIEGDHIVIGADNGNYNGDFTGTAYLFRRDASGVWPSTETQRLVNSVPGLTESLGDSIAFDGTNILVGATQTKVKKKLTGSVYIFELELGSEYCGAETNSLGLPAHLALTGSAHSADGDVTLSVRDCPPQAIGFFLIAPGGNQGLDLPLGEGRLCLGPRGVTRLRPAVSTGPLGILMYELDSREDVTYPSPGSTWSFQFLYRDPAGGPAGFNLTNAVELMLQ